MQQVRRGTVRKRGSQQALLARGIAAPRKTSTRLPVLAQARRLITRTPRTIRLGRIGSHARSKWLVLCALVLGSAVVYGAVIGGQTTRAYDALASALERSAIAAGFGVKKIAVTGQLHATDAAITAALGAGRDTMMLGFDTDAAKTRLEAVPWIRHAQVMRLLPSTLQVMVEERTPFAVWQSKGQTYVVDAEGVVLAPALRDAYTDRLATMGEHSAQLAATSTTHLNVIDREGNMVALTQTLLSVFGSKVVLPSSGILMNNGIMWFDPRPGSANCIGPGKRPLTNMCPVIATRDGRPWFAIGASGGRKIFPAVLQISSFLIDHDMYLEDAFHQPRIDASGGDTVAFDPLLPSAISDAVAKEFPTQAVELVVYPTNYACPSAVLRDPKSGEHFGAADTMSPWSGAVSEEEA